MRQNPHVRICGGPGSATTLVYPTPEPRDEYGSDVGRLPRFLRCGHVEPLAAQLGVSGFVRMNLQAIVSPEIQHALAADELAR